VLVSSHLLDLVQRISHRILVLHGGRRVALGTLDEIRAQAARGTGEDLEEVFFAITEDAPEAGGE
jgi:ABC-2 type transport system ATP-binding protein